MTFLCQSFQGLISIALSLDPLPILLLVSVTIFLVWYTGEEKKKVENEQNMKVEDGSTSILKVARLRKRSMVTAGAVEKTEEAAAGALVLQENVRHHLISC